MAKKRAAILMAVAALLVAAALFLLMRQLHSPVSGQTARIIKDGETLYEIDLSAVKEPYTLRIEDEGGHYNVIEVRPGSIGMIEADCPDLLCVKMGFIRSDALPVTCLPHRLVIRIEGGSAAPVPSAGVSVPVAEER